ncbi:MAG TPA: hypothetical protein VFZ09_24225 [Archangium sp.]|uniref:hypothetical protein n=1 Tax=Archangium sp. TaxID=1872627 RepID=UPI002E2F12DC|nr:hypothetical protein [Archangium sp.]HEX5749357.1 hypothetical protein [Archangium sp.]
MLVLIPIFLYALFLDDLLRYSLDVQEAVVSTVWDYTVQDYTGTGDKKFNPVTVQHYARLMYCDHESGKNRYDEKTESGELKDCAEEDHHDGTALVAHVCWLNSREKAKGDSVDKPGDTKQVTCVGPDKSVGDLGADGLYAGYHSSGEFNQGGFIHCSARAVVENYLLPQRFLPEFSDDKERVDLTKKMWRAKKGGNGYHDNAKDGDKGSAYFIKEQEMSILVDTWALTKPAQARPGKKEGELYERVNNVYASAQSQGYVQMKKGAEDFFKNARQSLLDGKFLPDEGGDDPRKPNLSIKPHTAGMEAPSEKIKQASGSSSYFNTEWKDWEQNRNQKTYEKRGPYYMGCRKPGTCR